MANRGATAQMKEKPGGGWMGGGGSAWLLYILQCLINKNAKVFVFPAQSRLMNI